MYGRGHGLCDEMEEKRIYLFYGHKDGFRLENRVYVPKFDPVMTSLRRREKTEKLKGG